MAKRFLLLLLAALTFSVTQSQAQVQNNYYGSGYNNRGYNSNYSPWGNTSWPRYYSGFRGFYSGFRGGANLTDVSNVPNTIAKWGGNFGFLMGYRISPIAAIEFAALYSFQGYQPGKVAGYLPPSVNLDYLKIPFIAKVFLYRGLNAEFGFSVNILTSALQNGVPIKGLDPIDLSIPIGLAYEFAGAFEAGMRYDISLLPIENGTGITNGALSLNFAVRF